MDYYENFSVMYLALSKVLLSNTDIQSQPSGKVEAHHNYGKRRDNDVSTVVNWKISRMK